MLTIRKLAMPWAPAGARNYCLPDKLLLTLTLGEAPEAIPAAMDVRRGFSRPAVVIDGGAIDRILTRFGGAARVARVHAAAASLGTPGRRHCRYDVIEQVSGVARAFLVEVEPGSNLGPLIDSLAQLSTVEAVSPDYVSVTPFEAMAAALVHKPGDDGWDSRAMVRASEALAHEPGDAAVIVGIIDSGTAPHHPELAGRFRSGYDTVQLSAGSVGPGIELLGDRSQRDDDPSDDYVGHGMGCSGIIGALGLGMPPGLAGQAQLLPIRALGAARLPDKSHAVGLGAISDLDAACKLAIDLGAKVLNMSFGTDDAALPPHSPKPHAETVRYACERGCILVAASGNDGEATRYWPAAHPEVIAVGAVSKDSRPARFSTRGDHVALCAPGESILTTALDGYQVATGTSFAAPFAAATAALLVARSLRRSRPLDGPGVKQLLMQTARPFPGGASGSGAGILDAAAALAALDASIDAADNQQQRQVENG